MARDRFATRALIIDTAASLIAARGASQLGVNSLADAAKCDKVLIYRYFGGLDGVLEAVGAERLLWPRIELEEEADGNESLADAVLTLVLEEWAALSSGTLMLQASASEVSSEGVLGASTSMQREDAHTKLIATLRTQHRVPPYIDLPAIVEILSSALAMFALRANFREGAGGGTRGDGRGAAPATMAKPPLTSAPQAFDPATPQGWRRIEKTLAAMTRALLDADGQ